MDSKSHSNESPTHLSYNNVPLAEGMMVYQMGMTKEEGHKILEFMITDVGPNNQIKMMGSTGKVSSWILSNKVHTNPKELCELWAKTYEGQITKAKQSLPQIQEMISAPEKYIIHTSKVSLSEAEISI